MSNENLLIEQVKKLAEEVRKVQKIVFDYQEVVHVALDASQQLIERHATRIDALELQIAKVAELESKVKTLEGDSSLKLP